MPSRQLEPLRAASVDYDWEWTNGRYVTDKRASWSKWLGDHVGVDYISDVSRIVLIDCESETVLANIRRIPDGCRDSTLPGRP